MRNTAVRFDTPPQAQAHLFSSFEDVSDGLYEARPLPVGNGDFSVRKFHPDTPSYTHDGFRLSARFLPTTGSAVGTFLPARCSPTLTPQTLLLGANGYMQPPTGLLMDKFLKPAITPMNSLLMRGVSYAHGKRGTSDVLTRQGRYTVDDIQDDIAADIQSIMQWMNGHRETPIPTVLLGHSQGAQHVAYQLENPGRYGLTRDQIRGVVLMNPMLFPHSQAMLMTPGFLTDIALRSLGRVAGSMITGKGLLFRGQKAFDAFVGAGDPNGKNERRVTEGTYPDSGMFFAQTLTSGTSPSLANAPLRELPISMIISKDDQLMSRDLQHKTADHLSSLGANVRVFDVPGKHFSPLVTVTGESQEDVKAIMDANLQALQHACSRV